MTASTKAALSLLAVALAASMGGCAWLYGRWQESEREIHQLQLHIMRTTADADQLRARILESESATYGAMPATQARALVDAQASMMAGLLLRSLKTTEQRSLDDGDYRSLDVILKAMRRTLSELERGARLTSDEIDGLRRHVAFVQELYEPVLPLPDP